MQVLCTLRVYNKPIKMNVDKYECDFLEPAINVILFLQYSRTSRHMNS
jgi:hypothetical protein